MVTEKRIAEVQARMEKVIATFGWMVRGVFPTEDDPGPPFSYTVGLHDKGLPELIVIGLNLEVGTMLLNDVAQHCLQAQADGRGLPLGLVELERWPMPAFLLAADTQLAEEMATAASGRSHGSARYVQVCIPDKHGKFPWEPGCSESFKAIQAVLGPAPGSTH